MGIKFLLSLVNYSLNKKTFEIMKKLYAAAALFLAAFTSANAQLPHVDLRAYVIIDSMEHLPPTNKGLSRRVALDPTINPFDSIPAGVFLTITRNGGGLYEGDKMWFLTPTGMLNSDSSASGYIVGPIPAGDSIVPDPGFEMTIVTSDGNLKLTDSINILLNIAGFESPFTSFTQILVPRANLVEGQVYGFFAHVRRQPMTSGGEDYQFQDTIPANNWAYIPVIWGAGNGIGQLFSTQYDKMDVYPNPANGGTINFSFELKKSSSYQVVRVLDLTGRQVMSVKNEAVAAGKVTGNLDVSKLAAGTYSIQVITEYGVAATKFVKN